MSSNHLHYKLAEAKRKAKALAKRQRKEERRADRRKGENPSQPCEGSAEDSTNE